MELFSTVILDEAARSAALTAVPSASGRSVQPLVSFEGFKVMLVAMHDGSRWTEHKTPARISVQVLRGHIRIHALSRDFDLPASALVVFESNVRHDIEALADSVFVLTVAKPDQPPLPEST